MFRALSIYAWLGITAVVIAVLAALSLSIYNKGMAAGVAQERAVIVELKGKIAEMEIAAAKQKQEYAENQTMFVRAHLIRVNELANNLQEIQNAHAKTQRALADARRSAAVRAERLRDIEAANELSGRLAAAECNVVRTFAAGAFQTATTCRNAVADLGLGTGGLVEASASAHYEHDRAEALIRVTMPSTAMPAGPFKE